LAARLGSPIPTKHTFLLVSRRDASTAIISSELYGGSVEPTPVL
jgi:hypothetical protein